MAETEPFNVVYLPEHILIHIFSYMSYSEISRIREVCQTFNRICSRELTKAFVRVDRLHSQIQKSIKSQLPRKESERRNHALSRFVDVLSALETRLSLLSMTYTKYIDLELCCFIPGMVLDELYQLLQRLQNTENQPPRAYDLLQSLRDLSTMAMEHFEEHIVPLLKAQMTERSQTLFFSPGSVTASSPLHSSLSIAPVSGPLELSDTFGAAEFMLNSFGCNVMQVWRGMSMLDCSWPMPLSVVSSPWRRTPLKLDVQRMQSQMQMHSAAIATMTKEYREQKVKIGEQSRILAEQERLLGEQRRLIQELKTHIVAQEKNQETLATHLTALTGKVVHLPETKAWDRSLWDPAPMTEVAGCSHMTPEIPDRVIDFKILFDSDRDMTPGTDVLLVVEGGVSRGGGRYHSKRSVSSTVTSSSSDKALCVEQLLYQSTELQHSLSSKCPAKRLLAQIALAIQRIAADHSLPVCLGDYGPRVAVTDAGGDFAGDLLKQLTAAQQQLSTFNEEHVGCSICAAPDFRTPPPLAPFAGWNEHLYAAVLPPVTNQGLVNRAQELYNRLNSLIQENLQAKEEKGSAKEEKGSAKQEELAKQEKKLAKQKELAKQKDPGKQKEPAKQEKELAKQKEAARQKDPAKLVMQEKCLAKQENGLPKQEKGSGKLKGLARQKGPNKQKGLNKQEKGPTKHEAGSVKQEREEMELTDDEEGPSTPVIKSYAAAVECSFKLGLAGKIEDLADVKLAAIEQKPGFRRKRSASKEDADNQDVGSFPTDSLILKKRRSSAAKRDANSRDMSAQKVRRCRRRI